MILLAVTLTFTECLVIVGIGMFFILGPWAQSREARKNIMKKNGYSLANNASRKEMEDVSRFLKGLDEFRFINQSEDEWIYKSTYKLMLNGKNPALAALFRAAHIAGVNISARLKKNREEEEGKNGSACFSCFVSEIKNKSRNKANERTSEDNRADKLRKYGYYK